MTTELTLQLLVSVLVSIIASQGLWTWLTSRNEKKSYQTELLIGLAHDRIVWLGMSYITRGWITKDEYENLNVYLFKPYEKLGGNGSVRRIMAEIDKLPIKALKDLKTGDTQP